MSVIIAIDPSCNSSGVCVLPVDGKTPLSYEIIIPPVTDHTRLFYNYSRYSAIFNTYTDIRCIAFEKIVPQMRYNFSAGNLVELAETAGILKLAIEHQIRVSPDLTVLAIPPGDVKTYAVGNSRATKEDMIDKVNGTHMKRIRTEIPEHSVNDIADAYHLSKFVQELLLKGEYSKYLYYKKSE